jgi:putative ABC transport system permease protein
MSTLWKDVRFALRMMSRSPGVTAAAVLALALGIGANTAIFSVVDGVLLRPLPYPKSHELVMLTGQFAAQDRFHLPLAYPEYKDLREMSGTLAGVAVYAQGDGTLTGGSGPAERVQAGLASSTLFPLLGVQPVVGRNFFVEEEEQKGRDQVALIAWNLWQRRYGGDPTILDKSIELDHDPYRVVGVLPKGFQLDPPCDLWVPISTTSPVTQARWARYLTSIGRLKPGVSPAQLRADLDAVAARQKELYPKSYAQGGWGLSSKPLLDVVVGDARLGLLVLLGAVGLVLLIACANVANLLLARAAARSREMAIRTALGAARGRLIRQLLSEAMLLSLLGGALGVLLAMWAVDAMIAMSPDALPRAADVALDVRVLAFTVGVSILTGLAFGLAPALSASRPELTQTLKDGTRGTTGGRGRLRRALVVSEVALSLMLLVGTGLLLRSFLKLRSVDSGFRPDHVLTMGVALPVPNGPLTPETGARLATFFQGATERLANLPGVQTAGAISILPLDGNSKDESFEIENYVPHNAGDFPNNEVRDVTPGYFTALGVPLVRGRLISVTDTADAPGVVVINQAMARRWWPGEDPVGKHLKFKSMKEWSTVIGVVGDVRGYGLDQAARPELYFPHAQLRRASAMALVMRTSGDPRALANSARGVIGEIDPNQPVFKIRTMEDVLASSLARRRFALVLMLIFAAVALVLAALGIYGVMSYTVAQRTQEIGIRVAVGARPIDVLGMVVRQGMTLVALGLLAGVAGALVLTRLLSALLYGVAATDAATYVIIAAALASVALVAILVPARRATRVDPMLALRAD